MLKEVKNKVLEWKGNVLLKIVAFLMLVFVYSIGLANCSDNADDIISTSHSATYYIDSESGNDTNTGLSAETPWKSLLKANNTTLNPGDTICFKRGAEFEGTLFIRNSGNEKNYIVVTDYGDNQLLAPSFTNPEFNAGKNNFGNCIRVKGSFVVVENLYCHKTAAQLPSTVGSFTTMWELGAIYLDKTAQHCIVQNNELYDCGVGIKSYGPHALISGNYIHDCNRVLKEWGWGPIGIWLGADYQEVCYNRIYNYSAVDSRITWGPNSYGGGADGGAMEIDDARNPKSNISIHHNYTRDCQGFLEVTWTDVLQNPPYKNFEIHHNVSDDYQQFVALWCGSACKIENNTIIRRKKNVNDWGVFNITGNNAQNYIRNNIVVVEKDIVIFNVGKNETATPKNIIANNLYYAASGALNIGKEGPGENAVFNDPKLLNYGVGLQAIDFSINSESAARNSGLELGYAEDFVKTTIPQEDRADIGAFEFVKE